MSLEQKLKEALIRSLLHNTYVVDGAYLIHGGKSYTRRELAKEIEGETEFGIDLMTMSLKLAVQILDKETKTNENEGLFPWEPWAEYEVVQPSGKGFQFDSEPRWDGVSWVCCKTPSRMKEVGQARVPDITGSLIKRYKEVQKVDYDLTKYIIVPFRRPGQRVNQAESAARVTCKETGIFYDCSQFKSFHQNIESAIIQIELQKSSTNGDAGKNS